MEEYRQYFKNNLWDIPELNKLSKFLHSHPNKIIILAVISEEMEREVKKYIKQFLKEKSFAFPNMIFLLHTTDKKNYGSNVLFPKNEDEYPAVHIIVNGDDLISTVTYGDDFSDSLEANFEYYNNDFVKNLNFELDKIKYELSSQNNQTTEKNSSENISQEDESMNKKKLCDKLILLKEKRNEYELDFLNDIARRKKLDEKNKKNKSK